MSTLTLHLFHHTEPYALASVAPGTTIDWDRDGCAIFSIAYTSTEISVICPQRCIPTGTRQEGPFHAFEVAGPLDFAQTGVLAGLFGPIAAKNIPLLSTSTYETDFILVPVDHADQAEQVWRREGFLVTPPILGDGS